MRRLRGWLYYRSFAAIRAHCSVFALAFYNLGALVMANTQLFSDNTSSDTTSSSLSIDSGGTLSVHTGSGGTPNVSILYEQPSSGYKVPLTRFDGSGVKAMNGDPKTIYARIEDNPQSAPVTVEWQDS